MRTLSGTILSVIVLVLGVYRAAPYPPGNKSSGLKASFYHDKFDGRKTSSGDDYDKSDFTAAHRSLPFNSILLVTNTLNHHSVVVRVNDRGPFKKSRIVDLSRAAAMKIGMVPFGVVPVQVKVLTLLDRLTHADTLLVGGSIWNCNAERDSLSGISAQLWKTGDWKHAFYMASNLELEHTDLHLVIRVSDETNPFRYELYLTGMKTVNEADILMRRFRNEGFTKAAVLLRGEALNQHACQ